MIEKLDFFTSPKRADFDAALSTGTIQYIPDAVLEKFVDTVYAQRVGDGAGIAELKLCLLYTSHRRQFARRNLSFFEECLLDPLLVDHDILCPKFILCCHQQVKRRLCICNHDLITANNCADGTVLLNFLSIHCFFPLQIPICLVLANPHPQHDCIRLSASFAGALNAEMLFQNPEDIVDLSLIHI